MALSDHNDLDRRTQMEPFDVALSSLISGLDTDGDRVSNQTVVARAFKEIAGQSVTEHLRAVYFDNGVVTAVMDSGIWAQELRFFASEYRQKLNEFLGGEVVTDVAFCTRRVR